MTFCALDHVLSTVPIGAADTLDDLTITLSLQGRDIFESSGDINITESSQWDTLRALLRRLPRRKGRLAPVSALELILPALAREYALEGQRSARLEYFLGKELQEWVEKVKITVRSH